MADQKKVRFFYGLMGSGKTEHLINKREGIDKNFGKKASLLIVPSKCLSRKFKNDQEDNFLYSRSGKSSRIDLVLSDESDALKEISARVEKETKFLFVDETQFFNLVQLNRILEKFSQSPFNLAIFFFGLENDFRASQFDAAVWLFDKIGFENCVEMTRPTCNCGFAPADCDALCKQFSDLVSAKFVHVCRNCVLSKKYDIVDAEEVFYNIYYNLKCRD